MSSTQRRSRLQPRSLWLLITLSFRADPFGSALLCLAMPVYYLSPAAGALATKFLVDGALEGDTSAAAWAAVLAAVAVLAAGGSLKAEVYLSYTIDKKVGALVQRQLAEMLARLPRIEHYERSDYLDEIQQLRDHAGELGSGLLAYLNMIGQVCQVAVVCALLVTQAPVLVLLPLFAIPSFVAAGWANRITKRAAEAAAEPGRKAHATVGLTGRLEVARELRLFGLADELRARHRALAAEVDGLEGHAQVQSAWFDLGGGLVFALGYFGAVIFVITRAAAGELTAGDVVLTVVLAGQANGFISGLVRGAKFLAGVSIVAARWEWLKRYETEQQESAPTEQVPHALADGVRLDHVSFEYPGTEKPVLTDLSIHFPAGSVIALVGENGAGKSSLIKLLLGYYRPSAGRIEVEGRDLSRMDPNLWRARTSGAFQDYCQFELLARETVGIGVTAEIENNAFVRAAVDRAGAGRIIDTLPNGLETQLGAEWAKGVDLSGGQWQRLALARAMTRTGPLLLVLDEPTASLDAEAEHRLFTTFARAAGQTQANGGITLLVTHRFSTVRMADLIIVLEHGAVRETGTHNELIQNNGLYAELYKIQAAAYT